MRSKLFLSGFLAAATLAGTVLFAANSHAFPCSYGNKFDSTNSTDAPTASGSTGNQINFDQPDSKKFGIAAGLAGLLGLGGGALFLKSRLSKREEQLPVTAATEPESYVEYPTFPIQVPSAALDSVDATEDTASTESSNSSIR